MDGLSARESGRRAGVSATTAKRVAKQYFPGRKIQKNGRPTKLSEREKAFCVRKITMGGKENAVQVQKSLQDELNIAIRPNTVRRALKSSGLQPIFKPKKPLLFAKKVKARLAWGKHHVDWTIKDWKRFIWSDEIKINRFGSDGKIYAWKKSHEPLQNRHVQQTVKHGGGNLNVWSCITWSRVGYIVKLEGNMTKDVYETILEEDLMKTISDYAIDPKKIIFQHDNDSKHTAHMERERLSNQSFEVMDWPSQVPDLNPI